MTLEINPFQYAWETNVANTKGYRTYLIPDGSGRSPLIFSIMLIPKIHPQQQRTKKEWFMLSVRTTLPYINPREPGEYSSHSQSF